MTFLRFAVMDMPAMMASYLPACSAGMMPSQAWLTISQSAPMRLQISVARSSSKPTSFPEESVKFQGL